MLSNNNSGDPYRHNNQQHVNLDEVDDYTLEDYGLNVDSIKSDHFGVDITDHRTGEELPDSFYESKQETAISTIEKELDIVIRPRVVTEHQDFNRNDFESHM